MTDDRQLLARYVAEASDEAFRELVRRHMGLVYSAALRQVRDPQLAQDVTQVVFANLARKARSIPAGTILAGWLHRDTRYTALDFLRAEARRSRREQQAAAMNALNSESTPDWEQIHPLLDEALDQLGPEDRDALLLRYFEERDYAAVGEALGASGEAARKRVDRALDRLREHLAKRGITTTAAALGTALSTHAIEAVPASFASALAATSAAVAAKAAAPAAASWLTNLTLMTNTKLVVGSVLVAAALTTPLLVQQKAIANARAEQTTLLARQREPSAQNPSTGQPTAQVAGADSAQRDRADLERLRRETALLRGRVAELNAQAQQLAQTRRDSSPKSAGIGTSSPEIIRRASRGSFSNSAESGTAAPIGQTFRITEARDAGQATPAAMMQTWVWAMAHGDTNRLVELMAFVRGSDTETMRRVWKTLEVMSKEFAEKGSDRVQAESQASEFRLLEELPVEGNDRWITLETVAKNGYANRQRSRVTKMDTGWRMLIGTNGEPVMEQIADRP